jgi:hypothetical protein
VLRFAEPLPLQIIVDRRQTPVCAKRFVSLLSFESFFLGDFIKVDFAGLHSAVNHVGDV